MPRHNLGVTVTAAPINHGQAVEIRIEIQPITAGESQQVSQARCILELHKISQMGVGASFMYVEYFLTTSLSKWLGEFGVRLYRDEVEAELRSAIQRAETIRVKQDGQHPGCCGS